MIALPELLQKGGEDRCSVISKSVDVEIPN